MIDIQGEEMSLAVIHIPEFLINRFQECFKPFDNPLQDDWQELAGPATRGT